MDISTAELIGMDYKIDAQNGAQSSTVFVEILRRTNTKIDDSELHQIVFNFLKQQNIHQTLVKCDNFAISELVEQITINQPILV